MSAAPTTGGHRKTLAVNAGATVLARLLVPAFNVLLVVSIARLSGAAGLGQYTLLITLFQLCEQLKSLGLTTYVVREVSRDHGGAASHYRSLVRIGYWGALCAAPVILAVALAKNDLSWTTGLAVVLMCSGLLPSAQVLANDAVFLALGRASYSLWIALAENVLRFSASIYALVFWHGGVVELGAIYAVARFVAAFAGALVRRRALGLPTVPYDPALTKAMLRKAPSFLTVFVAPLVLYRMDVLLLSVLATDYEVGVYSAAMRLISVAMILPDGVMTAMFAMLSRLAGYEDRTKYYRLIQGSIELMGAAIATAALCGFLAAPWVVHLLYGSKFDSSIPVLQILVWALVPILVNRVLGDSLVAAGEQGTVARIVVGGMVASAVLYLVLIRSLGMQGAAWGFLLSSFGLCVYMAVKAVFRFRIAAPVPVLLSLAPAALGALAVLAPRASYQEIAALVAAQAIAGVALICGRTWLEALQPSRVQKAPSDLLEVSVR